MSPFVRPAIVRLGDRLCAQSVLLVALGLLTLTFSGLPRSSGEELDFQTARALATGAGLSVAGTPEADGLVASGVGVRRVTGGAVSTRPIGAPVASIPFYWAGRLAAPFLSELEARHAEFVGGSELTAHLTVGWRNALFAAITAWLVTLAARRVGVERRHAWLGGLVFVAATFVWPQARTSSIEVQATFFLFLAFHLTLRARERFGRLLRPLRLELLGAGIALALAVLTQPALWVAALVTFGTLVASIFAGYRRLAQFALFLRRTWRLGHWVDIAWAGVPLLVGAVLLALSGQARAGTPLGPPGELWPALTVDAPRDLLLVLVAPGRGLLWLAPLVLFAPLGFAVALRGGARLWPACAVLVALSVFWTAHAPPAADEPWGFGPGRLLPALPFLWLGVTLALDRLARAAVARRIAYALCALGVLVNLAGVLVSAHTYQDLLGQQAAFVEPVAGDAAPDPEAVYRTAQWEPRLAAPWAHWRILRHRLATGNEAFPAARIFLGGSETTVEPRRDRDRGFRHIAWVESRDRLGLRPDPVILVSLVLVAAGCVLAIRGLDRALP